MALDPGYDPTYSGKDHQPKDVPVQPGTFKATLRDAFASAHLMRVDGEEVEICDATVGDSPCTVFHLSDFHHRPRNYYDSKSAGHVYTFVGGKTWFTDADEVVRTVEVYRLIPMTSLEEQ